MCAVLLVPADMLQPASDHSIGLALLVVSWVLQILPNPSRVALHRTYIGSPDIVG